MQAEPNLTLPLSDASAGLLQVGGNGTLRVPAEKLRIRQPEGITFYVSLKTVAHPERRDNAISPP